MGSGSDPVRWTGSGTALGYTWRATGTRLGRPVQEVSPLTGAGSVGPGRAGLHYSSGRAALSWRQSSRARGGPQLWPSCSSAWESLSTTTVWMGSTPICTGSTLFLSPQNQASGEGWDWNTLKRLPLISFADITIRASLSYLALVVTLFFIRSHNWQVNSFKKDWPQRQTSS